MIDAVCGSKQKPEFFAGGYTPGLVVSENYLKELTGDLYTELLDVSYKTPFYSVPVLVNLVLFVIVLGICAVILPMIYRGIEGKSVIERLRDVQE